MTIISKFSFSELLTQESLQDKEFKVYERVMLLPPPRPRDPKLTLFVEEQVSMTEEFASIFGTLATPEGCEMVIKLGEDALMFLIGMIRGKTKGDYLLAITNYVKAYMGDKPLFGSPFWSCIMKVFEQLFGQDCDFEVEHQSLTELIGEKFVSDGFSAIVDRARFVIDNFSNFKERPLFQKMYKLIGYIVSFSIFKDLGLDWTRDIFGVMEGEWKKRCWGADFVLSLCDMIVFIVERGIQCVKLGTWEPFVHSGAAYEEWARKALDLIMCSEYLSNPEAHGFCTPTYFYNLDCLLLEGKSIKKMVSKFDKKAIDSILMKLTKIKMDFTAVGAALEAREEPFAVEVTGASGAMKSTFVDILYTHFGLTMILPTEKKYLYTRIATDKYFVNFKSWQWGLCVDDSGYKKPGVGEPDNSSLEVIQIINNMCFMTPQASIDDKGTTPMRVKFVCFTTNTTHLNIASYFSCPYAALRRFKMFIDVRPKEKYRSTLLHMDPKKLPPIDPGCYPDYWDIYVYKVEAAVPPTNNQVWTPEEDFRAKLQAKFVEIGRFTDINTFCAFYSARILEHFKNQEHFMESQENMLNLKICYNCHYLTLKCICGTTERERSLMLVEDPIGQREKEEEKREEELERQLMCREDPQPLRGHHQARDKELITEILTSEDVMGKDALQVKTIEAFFRYDEDRAMKALEDLCNHRMQAFMAAKRIEQQARIMRRPWYQRLLSKQLHWFTEFYYGDFEWKPVIYVQKMVMYLVPNYIVLGACFYCEDPKPLIFSSFRAMGRWTSDRIGIPVKARTYVVMATKIAALVGAGYTIFRFLKPKDKEEVSLDAPMLTIPPVYGKDTQLVSAENQVSLAEIGKPPVARAFERPEAWPRNSFNLSTYELQSMTTSWKGMKIDDFETVLRRNTWRYTARGYYEDGKKYKTESVCLAVCDFVFAFNKHSIPPGDFEIDMRKEPHAAVTVNVTECIRAQQVYAVTQDLVFIRMMRIDPSKDIRGLFAKSIIASGAMEANIMVLEENLSITRIKCDNVHYGACIDGPSSKTIYVYDGVPKSPTKVGDCGSPWYVMTTMGPVILGIHFVANVEHKMAGAQPITHSMIEQAITHFSMPVVDVSPVVLTKPQFNIVTGDVHFKCAANYVQEGNAKIISGLLGVRPASRSKVVPQILQEKLKQLGYKTEFVVPTNISTWKPWYNGFKDRVDPKIGFDDTIVMHAAQTFLDDILEDLDESWLREVHVCDVFTATNGANGIAHVKSIDKNTSMGFPYRKTKKHFLTPFSGKDNRGLPDAVEWSKDILDEIQRILDIYQKGCVANPVFAANLKDEAVKALKNAEGRIRVFSGAPGPWVLVVRMYFLWVSRLVQTCNYLFGCAAGMNLMSVDWEVFFRFLTQFGLDSIIDGDYGKFDTTIKANLIMAAFWIFIQIAKKAGVTPEEIQVMYGISVDTAFNVLDFNGTIVRLIGCVPSGHPLTLIINSIINVIMMRIVYFFLNPDHECKTFKKNVALMTLGDDNVAGINRKECPWFNHTAIQQVFAAHGIAYTAADKSDTTTHYKSIYDVEFAKRVFRFEKELGVHVSPLSEKSITKMLFWRQQSIHVSAKAAAIEALRNASMEYFFYGREVFDSKLTQFVEIVKDLELQEYVTKSTFRSFDYWKSEFVRRSKHVKLDHDFVKSPIIMSAVKEITCEEEIELIIAEHQARMEEIPSLEELILVLLACIGFVIGLTFQVSYERWNMLREQPRVLLVVEPQVKKEWIPSQSVRPKKNYYEPLFLSFYFRNWDIQQITGSLFRSEIAVANLALGLMCQVPIETKKRYVTIVTEPLIVVERQTKISVDDNVYLPGRSPKSHQERAGRSRKTSQWEARQYALDVLRDKKKRTKQNINMQAARAAKELRLYTTYQSEAELLPEVSEQEATLEFHDATIGDTVNYGFKRRVTNDTTPDIAGFSNWLARPYLIDTFTWDQTMAYNVMRTVDPWKAFCSQVNNKFKLNNFAYVRGKLKIKISISANQFTYGCMMTSLKLLSSANNTQGSYGPVTLTDASGYNIMQQSQLPYIMIMPQSGEGGELEVPFLFNRNWLDLTNNNSQFEHMACLTYTVIVRLLSANSIVPDPVTVNTFCWMEDAELCGPSVTVAFQAKKDEYKGPISGPASAVAALANWFTKAPIIGPFATATQMGAQAVAAGAASLGYTNVPVIEDVAGLRPMVTSGLASAEIGFQLEKLTLDPKNELTIDNGAIGGSSQDELNLSSILQREAWLGVIEWDQSVGEESILASIPVNPSSFILQTGTDFATAYTIYSAPLAYFSQMFQYWRGDIILRFQIVASQFHKGRLRIAWDPSGDGANNIFSSDSTNTVFAEIYDIGTDKDFEIRIPYLQPAEWSTIVPWNNTNLTDNTKLPAYFLSSAGSFSHVANRDNGTLMVFVMNELSTPSAASGNAVPAYINVFVRGADNLEYGGPYCSFGGGQNTLTLTQPQSRMDVLGKPSVPKPERYLTNFGEGITSLRQVLRRSSLVGYDYVEFPAATAGQWGFSMTRFPPPYGYDPHGRYSAVKQGSVGNYGFNWTSTHPITWVQSCFLGVRGSVNWYFDLNGTTSTPMEISNFTIDRIPEFAPGFYGSNTPIVFNDYPKLAAHGITSRAKGTGGFSVTDTRVNPVLAVSLPNYSNLFFSGTNNAEAMNPISDDGSLHDTYALLVEGFNNSALDSMGYIVSYAGIGTDYNVVNFLHTPVVWSFVTIPTPV